MLSTITGLMNSGKTLFCTYMLFLHWLNGKIIVCNYPLNLPYNFKLVNVEFFEEMGEKAYVLENVAIGIDEAWLYFDSRSSMSATNKIGSFFFLQSSKDDTPIYLTAQHNGQFDLRIRNNQHKMFICERVLLLDGKFKKVNSEHRFIDSRLYKYLYIEVTEYKREITGLLRQNKIYRIPASLIFSLYDTKHKITPKIHTKKGDKKSQTTLL